MAALDIPLVSSDWIREFNKVLQRRPFEAKSLSHLVTSGVPRDQVLTSLYFYTHPQACRSHRSLGVEARGLAALLKKTRFIIEQTAKRIEAKALLSWRTTSESAAVDSLLCAAQRLEPLMKHYKEISSSRGKHRWDADLVHLWITIKQMTGQSHWEDLAYVLELAFEASGDGKQEWKPDTVRKVVTRYLESHPELHEYSELRIVREQPISTRPRCRSTQNRRTDNRRPSTAWPYTDH